MSLAVVLPVSVAEVLRGSVRFSRVILPVPRGGWLCRGLPSVCCQRTPAQLGCGYVALGLHELRSTRLCRTGGTSQLPLQREEERRGTGLTRNC